MGNQRRKVQKKKMDMKKIAIIVIVVVAILGVGSLGYYLGTKGNKEEAQKTKEEGTRVVQTEMKDGEILDYQKNNQLTLGKYKDLTVVVTPTDEEVYQDILLEAEDAKVDSVDAQTFRKGDYVCINYGVYINGAGDALKDGSYACFKLGDYTFEGFPSAFENELIGEKVGENIIVNLTMPANYEDANLAGKQVVIAVETISKFDDAYAKKMSKNKYSTAEEYVEYTRKKLLKDNKDTMVEDAWEQVMAESKVSEYPKGSKKAAIKELNRQYEMMAELQDSTVEEFLATFGMDDEAIADLARDIVKERMIAKTIAAIEGLELTKEKYYAYLKSEMEVEDEDTATVQELEKDYKKNVSENVRDGMLVAMVKDFIGESLKQE